MASVDRSIPAKLSGLVVVMAQTANLLAALDATIVNVAMPAIAQSTGAPLHLAGWVITSYTLTLTTSLLLMAHLGDLFGRARLFSCGFVLFTAGSALCALSPGIGLLITARAIQGIGAACLLANGTALISEHTEEKARGFALGLNSTTVNIGYSLGYILGGLIISFADWRWIFTINIFFGLGALLVCLRLLPSLLHNQAKKPLFKMFDVQGALLSSLAVALLFYSCGAVRGVESATTLRITMAAGACIALVLFFRRQFNTPHPLIPLEIFRDAGFTLGICTLFLFTQVIASCSFLFPFYLQGVQGVRPSDIGFILAPYSVMMCLVAPLTGVWSIRMNPGWLAAGGFLVAMSVTALYSFFGAATPVWWLVAGQFGLGLAAALFLSPNRVSIMTAVSPQHLGIASGLMQVMRFLGLSVGTMLSSNVIGAMLEPHGGLIALSGAQSGAVDAFIVGQNMIFVTMSLLLFLGAVLSLCRAELSRSSGARHAA